MNTTDFWDKRAPKYDESIRKHDPLYERTIQGATALLSESDVTLDFACASGEMSLDIAPHVRSVHGVDLSAKMIELARQKARDRRAKNVRFDPIDVFDPMLANHTFSTVFAFNIFHLLNDAPRVLARLNELLTPGGLLVSQTPCLGERNWLFRFLIGAAQKTGLAPTIQSFNPAGLETLVSGGGFKILESKTWDEKTALRWIVGRKA